MRALPVIFSVCLAMGSSLCVAAQTAKIPVVASFSILGDMTQFTDGTGPVWKGGLFPFLFITIALRPVHGQNRAAPVSACTSRDTH